MNQALAVARRGEGLTMPNPPVGAVVVSNGRVRGSGFHRRAGGAHAEILALKAAGRCAKGACLYVTLEPCCTRGKTGPCTDAVINSGIRRVVVAVRDPNPLHNGKGIGILRKAGIQVEEGVCREEAAALIRPFAKWITLGRPFLTLKLGISIDGRIADGKGRSKWITSAISRNTVRNLRRRVDAILIGAGTARKDDPGLLCRRTLPPFRIVVDSRGTLPLDAGLLNDPFACRTIVATTESCPAARRRLYSGKGAQVLVLPSSQGGRVSLNSLMRKLGKMGILHILCEGGGILARSLIAQDLVDEYLFFVAPAVIGGSDSVASVAGKGWSLASCPRFEFIDYRKSGADIEIRAIPARKRKVQ